MNSTRNSTAWISNPRPVTRIAGPGRPASGRSFLNAPGKKTGNRNSSGEKKPIAKEKKRPPPSVRADQNCSA